MSHHDIAAERLTIYCTETARHAGKTLYEWLLHEAAQMHLRGATAHRALAGYGQHGRLHQQQLLDLSLDLPVVVEIVDEPARIEAFLTAAAEALRPHTYIRENVRWHQPQP